MIKAYYNNGVVGVPNPTLYMALYLL